ncbi:Mitochondrial carrier protein [Yarrowia sp. B02]|nr:Mitochondrial carrier protein [Yarrowia sp. B02]
MSAHGTYENKRTLAYVCKSGLAGGMAGCVAKTVIAPLDRVKILFQTSNPEFRKYRGSFLGFWRAGKFIYQQQGVWGLFQGHSATLLRIFPYAAVKFVAYEQFRALLISGPDQEVALRRMAAGSLSGIVSVYCTYPLELIRVRMAYATNEAGKPHGGRLLAAARSIYAETPSAHAQKWFSPRIAAWTNFYRGFTPTIMGMIPYAGVSFLTHDYIHDLFHTRYFRSWTVKGEVQPKKTYPHLLETNNDDVMLEGHHHDDEDRKVSYKREPLKAWAQLIAGGVAGMVSQTASYPFEVIRRRMQVAGAQAGSSGVHPSIVATALTIYKESGFKGFFVGLTIGYIKVTPMVACSFFVYERMKHWLGI